MLIQIITIPSGDLNQNTRNLELFSQMIHLDQNQRNFKILKVWESYKMCSCNKILCKMQECLFLTISGLAFFNRAIWGWNFLQLISCSYFLGQILTEVMHFTHSFFNGDWTPKMTLKENSVVLFACSSCCPIVMYYMNLILY